MLANAHAGSTLLLEMLPCKCTHLRGKKVEGSLAEPACERTGFGTKNRRQLWHGYFLRRVDLRRGTCPQQRQSE